MHSKQVVWQTLGEFVWTWQVNKLLVTYLTETAYWISLEVSVGDRSTLWIVTKTLTHKICLIKCLCHFYKLTCGPDNSEQIKLTPVQWTRVFTVIVRTHVGITHYTGYVEIYNEINKHETITSSRLMELYRRRRKTQPAAAVLYYCTCGDICCCW
jgi:hypothetical protein